jgi:hypothetical protein
MHRSLTHLACAVLLAAAAPIALAQTVYKLIDRHG